MPITIRPARSGDVDVLGSLMTELVGHDVPQETIHQCLEVLRANPSEHLSLCEVDGKVEGAFGFRLRENLEDGSRYGEVSLLVTAARARGKGLGQAMMEFAEDLAREHGRIGTWLVSGFGREEEVHAFYQRLGYRITGYRFVKPFEAPGATPP